MIKPIEIPKSTDGIEDTLQKLQESAKVTEADVEDLSDDALSEVDPSTGAKEEKSGMDYKFIVDLIKSMEESVKTLEDSVIRQIKSDRLNEGILDGLLPYKREDLESTTPVEEIRELIKKYIDSDDEDVIKYVSDKFDALSDDEIREGILEIKDMSIAVMSARKEYESIKKDSTGVLDDYVNFLNSKKIKDARRNNLQRMKEAVENEPDELKKTKMKRYISQMEASMDYSFLFKPYTKYPEREIKQVEDGYFDQQKGSYIIHKYEAKIKNFGYNPNIYHYFLNIEETFCDKKYSPFNNLFLFIYMRMVAYSDPYNKEQKLYVNAATAGLADLIYHKFDSNDDKEKFVKAIETVLDNYMDDIERFKAENTTWEGHPVRIEQMEEHDKHRREKLFAKLEELKYPEEIDKDIPTNELQDIFDKYIDELVDSQAKPLSDREDGELPSAQNLTDAIGAVENNTKNIDELEPVINDEVKINADANS